MASTHFVAKAIVLNEKGDFLLLTRSDTHPTLAGYFDLPGGMIEQNEEPGEAVKREILEETALVALDHTVLFATTMMIGESSYPTLLYLAHIAADEQAVELSWEHSDYEWAPLSRLAEVEPQLAPTYRQALAYIRENRILEDISVN